MSTAARNPFAKQAPAQGGLGGVFEKLHNIKIGGGAKKMSRRDLAFVLSNLSTLLENGVSLPKALATLAEEKALKKHAALLEKLRRRVELGESFSKALSGFPDTFSEVMVAQVKVGERSGTIAKTLRRITEQIEQGNELKGKVLKKLSYPLIVMVAGGGVVTFLLMYVVPTFEETYTRANMPLPMSTKILVGLGDLMLSYGWLVPVVGFLLIAGVRYLRKDDAFALKMDRSLVKMPVLGIWFRDMAVLEFVEVMGTMLQSGFKIVDALHISINSIGNRAVRNSVESLRGAILRGERLSKEIENNREMFPPIVSQLVIVGEQTGNLSKSTMHIRDHLRKEIERRAEMAVGTLEPVLTIGMAVAIGLILMAIYMPMFGMVDAIE